MKLVIVAALVGMSLSSVSAFAGGVFFSVGPVRGIIKSKNMALIHSEVLLKCSLLDAIGNGHMRPERILKTTLVEMPRPAGSDRHYQIEVDSGSVSAWSPNGIIQHCGYALKLSGIDDVSGEPRSGTFVLAGTVDPITMSSKALDEVLNDSQLNSTISAQFQPFFVEPGDAAGVMQTDSVIISGN